MRHVASLSPRPPLTHRRGSTRRRPSSPTLGHGAHLAKRGAARPRTDKRATPASSLEQNSGRATGTCCGRDRPSSQVAAFTEKQRRAIASLRQTTCPLSAESGHPTSANLVAPLPLERHLAQWPSTPALTVTATSSDGSNGGCVVERPSGRGRLWRGGLWENAELSSLVTASRVEQGSC